MRLEDFRKNDLGQIYAWFPQKGDDESSMFLVTYPYYSIKAFYFSCQNLEQLEQSQDFVNQGNVSISAIGFWFLAIEAFLNTLLKVACFLTDRDFKKFKGKELNSRISATFELLEIDGKNFYESGIFSRFREFQTFRNEVFHDRSFNSRVEFHKTSFSAVPYLANQVDVIQASSIALEIFQSFRFVYPGLDLMPNVYIKKDSSFGYLKYDLLYKKIVQPLFSQSLAKHDLTTDFTAEPTEISLPETLISKVREVEFCMRALPREELTHSVNATETSISAVLFSQVSSLIRINSEENFQVADYHRI